MAVRRFCIELFFDEETETALNRSLRRLAESGLPSPLLDWGTRPHLTAAVAEQVDAGLKAALAAFARSTHARAVRLASVGTFRGEWGAAFFAPEVTPELQGLHRDIYTCCSSLCGEFDAG